MVKNLRINFNEVKIKDEKNKNKIIRNFSKIIDKGIFLEGEENKKLERTLKNLLGGINIVTTASGHDAILLSLNSLKLNKDDEVIFPVNSYPTAFPVYLSGVKPVPVDVDENGQLDPESILKYLTKKTKVIIVVHLYGLVGNLSEIIKIARQNKITLIEDCAQSFGTLYKNKLVGTFGDIACFSFYPTKNIGTLGDGGAIATKYKNLFDYAKKAKSYGEKEKYNSEFVSGHSRIPELQAAVLNLYLKSADANFIRKKALFEFYKKKLQSVGDKIRLLESDPDSTPLPHLLVIEAEKRDQLKEYLRKNGIETHIHYPYPIHLVAAFNFLKYKQGDFPVAERLSKNVLSLPFHSYLTKKQVDFIVKSLKEFYD